MRANPAILAVPLLSIACSIATADVVSAQAAPLPSPRDTAEAGGLELHELLDRLATRNPRLRAQAAAVDAAGARVAGASTLPDPMLQIGVMNFGLPDLDTDMPNSMAPSIQLVQTVPFPGKLGLRGELAGIASAVAEADVAETGWALRSEATSLFFDLYAVDRRIEVMTRTLDLLRDFQGIAKAMYASGSGRQADVLRADVEVARMDGELRRLGALRSVAVARLNGLVDLPPGTPVATPVLPDLPRTVAPADTLRTWARSSRPRLDGARLRVRGAATGVELAHRDIWPDVSVGVAYGQRASDTGTRRMGSVMVGFGLPVHAARRQLASRDEADALHRMAEADLGAALAEVDARIGEELAELDRARSLIDLYRTEVLPQARATVESALSSYRVGAVDFTTLVDAQLAVDRFEGDLHRLVADYGTAIGRLESVVGRPMPATDATVVTLPEER